MPHWLQQAYQLEPLYAQHTSYSKVPTEDLCNEATQVCQLSQMNRSRVWLIRRLYQTILYSLIYIFHNYALIFTWQKHVLFPKVSYVNEIEPSQKEAFLDGLHISCLKNSTNKTILQPLWRLHLGPKWNMSSSEAPWEKLSFPLLTTYGKQRCWIFLLQTFWSTAVFVFGLEFLSFYGNSFLQYLGMLTLIFQVPIHIESSFLSKTCVSLTPWNLTNPKRCFLVFNFLEMKMSKTLPHLWKSFHKASSLYSFGKIVKKMTYPPSSPIERTKTNNTLQENH